MEGKLKQNLDTYIGKLLLYARQYDAYKLLKYLRLTRNYMKPGGKAATFGSQVPVEIVLRKKGALEAISFALRSIVNEDCIPPERTQEYRNTQNSIVNEALSILGNAFVIDPESRKEAFNKYDFVTVLHRIMEHPNLTFIDDIQTRALKCLGNLSTTQPHKHVENLTPWHRRIMRSGILSSVLRIINNVKKTVESQNTRNTIQRNNPIVTAEIVDIPKEPMEQEKAELVKAAVRAVRILAENPETQTHLCRLDAIVIVGGVLVWPHLKLPDSLVVEISRAVTALSSRLRSARHEVIFELCTTGEPILKEIMKLFRTSETDKKLSSRIIDCLTNFAKNKEIVSMLRPENIFNIIFSRIETSFGYTELEQLLRLLRELVTQDSIIHSFLLPHSSEVGSTLKILQSSELAEYHCFLLNFYENLHGSSIPALTSLGLIDLLQELLRETYKDCNYENIRNLIYTTDSDICPAHSNAVGQCPFLPVYRCTSPSYLQVQKEVKEYLAVRNMLSEIDVRDQNGGCYSRCNSWSSGEMSDGEDDLNGGQFSPCSPPKDLSPVSSTAGSDADEGVGGESNIYPDVQFEFSDGEDLPMSDVTPHRDRDPEKNVKRRKLNFHSISPSIPSPDNFALERETEGKPCVVVSPKDQRIKIQKLAAIIGILKKLVHTEQFKPNLLSFAPTLLALLCDGKLSCMNYEATVESPAVKDETTILIMRCFYGSDYILREVFSKIGNFQPLLEAGIIPLINRLTLLGIENEESNDELKKCNCMLQRLLPILSGEEHETSGWRNSFLMQSLTSTTNQLVKEQARLAIPLLCQSDGHYLRDFENKGHAWSELFSTLGKVDDIPSSLFQDTIVSLATLCKTFGMKWTEQNEYAKGKQLVPPNFEGFDIEVDNNDENSGRMPTVVFELDDGECISVEKERLMNASPVFEAMFAGHFREAEDQRVKLPNTSRKALQALLHQINGLGQCTSGQSDPAYDLQTVFDLLSLSNHFLLSEIHEKTFNSIITSYFCPYSAPTIYEQAIQMPPQEKPTQHQDVKQTNGAFNFPLLVLKYLLVCPGISCSLQCSAFKNIFDKVEPFIVIRDLKCIFEHYSKSRVNFVPTPRRRSGKGNNIMLKY